MLALAALLGVLLLGGDGDEKRAQRPGEDNRGRRQVVHATAGPPVRLGSLVYQVTGVETAKSLDAGVLGTARPRGIYVLVAVRAKNASSSPKNLHEFTFKTQGRRFAATTDVETVLLPDELEPFELQPGERRAGKVVFELPSTQHINGELVIEDSFETGLHAEIPLSLSE